MLVGPVEAATPLIGRLSVADRERLTLVPATQHIGMGEQPARAVRAKRDASVAVAARLVATGEADAVVSAGSTGATMTAAVVALGRLPGISRPALAAVMPALRAPLVLLDVGANPGATAELLVQYALVGAVYARVRLGIDEPRVGLLNVGTEAGKGDAVRRAVAPRLEQALLGQPARFLGNVEAQAVALGGVADVVVTDGFTGNVLVKGIEGVLQAVAEQAGPAAENVLGALAADPAGGAILLGVDGVVVVGHGATGAPALAACVTAAAAAVREDLLGRVRDALGDMSSISRTAAGVAMRSSEATRSPDLERR